MFANLLIQVKHHCLRPRKLTQHKRYCDLIDKSEYSTEFSKEYGVNRLSILDQVPFFDVCQCLPHDVMHIILKGVLPRNVRLLLNHCINEEQYFTVNLFNQCVATFFYGYSEQSNAPSQID